MWSWMLMLVYMYIEMLSMLIVVVAGPSVQDALNGIFIYLFIYLHVQDKKICMGV